jgi:hypothetical protein
MELALAQGLEDIVHVACPMCDSMLASQNSLASHKSRYHRSDGSVPRASNVSAGQRTGECSAFALLIALKAKGLGHSLWWRRTDSDEPFDISIRCSDQEHLKCVTPVHRDSRGVLAG